MRLYLKLLVMLVVFAIASSSPFRQMTGDLAYDARVAFVCAIGDEADYQLLIDDTQRTLAHEAGHVDLYLRAKRYRELRAERLAAAARLNIALSDEDLFRIQAKCVIDAFGPRAEPLRVTRMPMTADDLDP
jgi:hypothetical protein